MTSRHWKDKREAQDFVRQLSELMDGTATSEDLTWESIEKEHERQYWDDVSNGLFDDYPDDDYYDDYNCDDFVDPLYWYDDDDEGDTWLQPGNHVRDYRGETWLVLEDYRWANLLTGKVMGRCLYANKQDILM